LIFTSPPYFNTERYSKDDTQSWVRYKGINDWNEKFLHKALKNVWETLKPGGIMIVNIADIYDRSVKSYVKICDPMVEYMKTIDDCIFEGVIGMEMSARPGTNSQDRDTTFCEPCWIFKKE
jgi:DNA modification methylase